MIYTAQEVNQQVTSSTSPGDYLALSTFLSMWTFYQHVSIASYANRWYSQMRNVRLSVCHTPVLYQNEES